MDVLPRDQQRAGASTFFMPAETARHAACWMGWPSRAALWGDRLAEVKREYALIANTIADHEPVIMAVNLADAEEARAMCGPRVQIFVAEIDDSWLRDSGPTFLIDRTGQLAIVNWRFNAWGGKYQPHAADATLKAQIAHGLGVPLIDSFLVAEGGALLSDGDGTIFTTESCLLNRNRNPGLSKREVERELLRCLNAQKVVWLPGDETETETDGHIDGLASVARPGLVVLETAEDPADPRHALLEENRRALASQTDARGRKFEIVKIGEAREAQCDDPRFCRFLCQLLRRQRCGDRAGLRHSERRGGVRGGCRRLSRPQDRPVGAQDAAAWRRQPALHHPTAAGAAAMKVANQPVEGEAREMRAHRSSPGPESQSNAGRIEAPGAGWHMPAEFAPHARCWMAFPSRSGPWGDSLPRMQRDIVTLARAIRRFEPVTVIVAPGEIDGAAAALGPAIDVLPLAVDDLWIRDTGPTFLQNESGMVAAALWRFNAWGEKFPGYDNDRNLAQRLASAIGVRAFPAPLVTEGGALQVDGDGTVLATESSILNDNRNPGMTKSEAERILKAWLGAEAVIWLPGSRTETVTDGHVDGFACFVRPGVAVAELPTSDSAPDAQEMKENLRALRLHATPGAGRLRSPCSVGRPTSPLRCRPSAIATSTSTSPTAAS